MQRPRILALMLVALHGCGVPGAPSAIDAALDVDAAVEVDAAPTADAGDVDDGDVDATSAIDAASPDAPLPPPDQVARTVLGYGIEPPEGGRPPLVGIAALLDSDRAVFADRADGAGLVLSLVDVGATRALALDQVVSDLPMDRFFGSSDWSDRFLTHLVPLSADRLAVVGTRSRIELFASDRRLQSLTRLGLDPRDDSILDATGRGADLWLCSGNRIRRYRVADTSIEAVASGGFTLPAGTCRSLALSPDGRTLWVAGTGGIVGVDPATSTISRHILSGQGFARVLDHGSWLLAQTLLPYGDLGPVLVFRTGDLPDTGDPVPAARFDPVTSADLWQRPVAMALVDGAVAIESFEVRGETRRYRLDIHPWTDAGPGASTGSLTLRESGEVGLHVSPLPVVGRGTRLVAQPWRRMVRIAAGGVPSFVTGVHHGGLDQVWSTGPGTALALGAFSVHRVTTAGGPALVDGGQVLPATTGRLRLVRRDGRWQLVAATVGRSSIVQEPRTATVSCLVSDDRDGVVLAGTVDVPAGDSPPGPSPAPSLLAVGGGYLYQLGRPAPTRVRLRRFPLPDRCAGAMLTADLDRTFDIEASPGTATRIGSALTAAADGSALLLTETAGTGTPGQLAMHVAWIDGRDLAVVARGRIAASTAEPTALAIRAGDALVVENQRLVHRVTVDGAALAVATVDVGLRDPPLQLGSILAVDGDIAYFGTVAKPFGVLAAALPEVRVISHCTTPVPPRSISFVGADLVVGMPNAVGVCSAATALR